MRFRAWICPTLLLSAAGLSAEPQSQAPSPIPHLERRGDATQLIVDRKPFLVLAGELYNNSATSLEYMNAVWPRLTSMHLNTVLAAVSWAQLEPAEGKFDYALVDGLIREARVHNLRLVLLWFGSWKNTWSSYAPDWVKRNFERFPRVQLRNGSGTERLTPFSQANCDADARAFAALMRRIHEVDGEAHTVIMIQVENEVGVIPDARDYSAQANDAYSQPVPGDLMEYLRSHKDTLDSDLRTKWQAAGFKASGNWETVFGPGLETTGPDEFYMAGSGLTVTFSPDTPGPPLAGLATVEEGRFVDGQWVRGRTLAGDDTGQGNSISLDAGRHPGILRVTLYRYR